MSRYANYLSLLITGLLLIDCASQKAYSQLFINEVVTCNDNIITDSFDNTPDWIEIFNNSADDVDLNKFFLSDKPSNPKKWQFPKVQLKSKSYLVVYASNDDVQVGDELHTNFKIDSDGETILLSDETSIVSQIDVPTLACDFSYGYLNDYEDSLVVFAQPTPGNANSFIGAEVELQFSHNSGFFKDDLSLSISASSEAEIRYTINTAQEPSKDSDLYTNPLTIKSRVGDENVFSEIPTTDTTAWSPPKGEIFKINIVRAAAFIDGEQVSKVHTKSYGISPLGNDRYSFPVMSLVTQPNQFFSDSIGIYVLGDKYKINSDEPNFKFDWERDVFVEFIEKGQTVISQEAEIEIAGQTTRWRRQKSLKLKASGKGNNNRFEHPFFDSNIDKFRTLILRSSFTDYRKSFIKDQLVNKLAEKTGLADVDCKPVIVFLNGEYWGIHILEEKQDKYYFQDHYDVDKDSIHLLQKNATESYEVIEGSGVEYLQLRDYAETINLQEQQRFDYVAERINIENYINYNCFSMLIAMRDWPSNNIKYWRPMDNSRKWEWIPHDFDSSYNFPETDVIALATEPANETVEWSVLLFNNLMENENFKSQLLLRMEELLNNHFCVDSVRYLIDEYKDYYEPEIAEHIERWNFEESYSWEDEIAVYNRFPDVLSKVTRKIVKDDFDFEMFLCDSVITSIDENDIEIQTQFHIYPNPAISHINVISERKIDQLYISDITGSTVLETGEKLGASFSIDINALPVGIYFVNASAGTGKFMLRKFIKLD